MLEIKTLTSNNILWETLANFAENCSWSAGVELSKRMKENKFSDWERVFVALIDGDIAGYCILSKTDCIPNLPYTPYVSFVFVKELYRGNRISEKLCLYAIEYAKSIGFNRVYLISDRVNLYEKYGFVKIDEKQDSKGRMETIFMYPTTSFPQSNNPY